MKHDSRASIGPGTKVSGRVSGDGDLLVEGRVDGDVALHGHLTVGVGGTVAAPISVATLTVEGAVEGDVVATGAVTVRSGGTLRGNVRAEGIALEDGARFSGRIEMDVELPGELSNNSPRNDGASRERG